MKEETKRFYDFPLAVLKEKLELEGEVVSISTKDDRGKESDKVKIITIETKDK